MKVIVLGAGLVGAPMAFDLAKDNEFDVTVADFSTASLNKFAEYENINTIQLDVTKKDDLKSAISNFDFVLNAVPGFLGFETMKTIIESKKNVVDISFFPENQFDLKDLAENNNVTAIIDCGVAPGMSNILVGYLSSQLDKTENVEIYVGGLPEVRKLPYEYKAVFSPIDVIEEYTRPARYIENGKMVIKPALTDQELMNFPNIGTLESFNSDGLRSLAETIDAPNMKEKTLRYPGHVDKMKLLRETGFFEKEEIEVNGMTISPLDFTAKLLFPKWKLEEGEVDITVMKIIVNGIKDGLKVNSSYFLYDKYDAETKVHSMARTTGYTATMALRMLAKGVFDKKGLILPEFIGKDESCVNFILNGLEERGIVYQKTVF
ncbi:MAG: saccharopine dehydrogenase family protein [Bacteroidetes bacterium]|nr:saccharopine dehydrogenase family protein [Bacteroidota bacterium]MBU1116349.1 saccharopine dehydrogenase family protein [Bacteroidota bacterium]MBU1800373.1 saccharopine dehydrogenase family protein [Bacteroidota bacterium]